VPVCPIGDAARSRHPHFLYRFPRQQPPDRFRCYQHTDLSFYRCWTCDFPVQREDLVCRRCGTGLQDCRFCTARFALRIPAMGDDAARCPNCHLPRRHRSSLADAERVPADALFCSNLYGCPAGVQLDSVWYLPGTDECRICGSAALPLLKVLTRADHIGACRHCRLLFSGKAEPVAVRPRSADGNCCLCGRPFSKTDAVPDDALAAIVSISRALRCNDDDDAVFRELHAAFAAVATATLDATLTAFLRGIERPSVRRAALPRIERLLAEIKRQYGCQHEGASGAPGDC